MEYYELQELWDRRGVAETNLELNKKAIGELMKYKVQGSLSEIKWSSIIEIVVNFFWLNFLIQITIGHFYDTGFLISAAVLFLLSIYTLIFEINKLYLISTINYNASILQAQRKIERIKFLENLDLNSLYFVIPMAVIPFMVVLGEGVLHIDFEVLGIGNEEMIGIVLGSIIVAAIVVFFLRKFELNKLSESIDFMKGLDEME